jgi:hypothetical protein
MLKKWFYKKLSNYYFSKWYRYNAKTEKIRKKSLKYWDLTHRGADNFADH